jgi:hypothetical protein
MEGALRERLRRDIEGTHQMRSELVFQVRGGLARILVTAAYQVSGAEMTNEGLVTVFLAR